VGIDNPNIIEAEDPAPVAELNNFTVKFVAALDVLDANKELTLNTLLLEAAFDKIILFADVLLIPLTKVFNPTIEVIFAIFGAVIFY